MMCKRLAFTILVLSGSANAAYYDLDMSIDVQKGLPSVEAILAGKFERHSDAFYDSVIRDQASRSKPVIDGNKPVQAPLGVVYAAALARRGQYQQALKAIDPNRSGAFQSAAEYSTRGSVLLAVGDLPAAISELQRAVQDQPESAFGRDAHQLLLAQYLLNVQQEPELLSSQQTCVSALLAEAGPLPPSGQADARVDAAQTALLAMIRYDDSCLAHVYAALGEILEYRKEPALAYRAYRRAIDSGHPWQHLIQPRLDRLREALSAPAELDRQIEAERAEADVWVRAFQATESRERAQTGSPTALQAFYSSHGNLRDPVLPVRTLVARWITRYWPAVSLSSALIVLVLFGWIRQRWQKTGQVSAAR